MLRPCAELFDAPLAFFFCRPRGTRYHFRPTFHRRRRLLVIVALLLRSGIESNPGPSSHKRMQLNLGLINAQSIVNKAARVHDIIEDNHLDLLAVTETWVYEDSPNVHKREAAPSGYSVVHQHRKLAGAGGVKKCGGGVALIHRSDIRLTVLPTRPAMKFCELLLVKVANCALGLTIAIVYRAPDTSVGDFATELSDLIHSGRLGTRHVICGDLNCPGPAGTKGLVAVELAEVIDEHGLRQHVREPTHRAGNTLDHILTPEDGVTITDVVVTDVGISDHFLVTCRIAASIDRPPIERSTFRNWKRLDKNKFEEKLRSSAVYMQPATTAEAFAVQLEECVTAILDELIPWCTSTKRRQKPESRWLSDEAVAAKRKRRRLERKWKKTEDESVRKEYRKVCREANDLITESRQKSCADRVTQASHDPRTLWLCVKSLLHTSHSTETTERGMSQRSADFFKTKIAKVKSTVSALKAQITPGQQHQQPAAVLKLDTLAPTTVAEVTRLISRLPAKTSPLDYVHTSVVKACSGVFAPIITKLANLSFAEGRFPVQFKLAQVTPLLKKAGLDTSDPANYRPISNLNTISKIIERLVLARLLPHIAATGKFNPLQSAYRKQHSTETALLKILDDLNKVVNSGKTAVLVGLDLSAAFDTIEHDILLDRLRTVFGVSGEALVWIETYLRGRKQYVMAGGERSTLSECDFGVPQGSVLGPFLFSIYVSPIIDIITTHGVQFHQYADDTQLYIAIHSNDDLVRLEKCTSAVKDWFTENGMLLNPDKSEVLLVASQRNAKKVEPGSGCFCGWHQDRLLRDAEEPRSHTRPELNLRPACAVRRQGQQLSHPRAAAHQTNVGPRSGKHHRLQHRQHQARLLQLAPLRHQSVQHQEAAARPEFSRPRRCEVELARPHDTGTQRPSLAACQAAHRVQGRAGHSQGAGDWPAWLPRRSHFGIQAGHQGPPVGYAASSYHPHRAQVNRRTTDLHQRIRGGLESPASGRQIS